MSDPAVCSFITKVLCSNGGRLEYSKISQHVELSEQQLEQILQDVGQERFLVHKEGGSRWVLAVSPLRLCVRKECEGCERLHFCKLNLMGKCNFGVRACKYSHDIFTDENRKVLKTHEVSGLNENELRVLLLQNDPFLLPDVCQFYNKECRFSKCNRSHRILDGNVLRLLIAEGLNIITAKNIQVICDHKHTEFSKEVGQWKMPPPHNRATPVGDKKKASAGNPEDIGPRPTSTTPASTSHESFFTSLADQNINFKSITSSSALLRRLSTPSSVTKPPKFIMTTKWIWYWKNDLGQWIEYGKQDGLHGASALTSDDLENLFLANPNDTLQFQAGSQQYEINFKGDPCNLMYCCDLCQLASRGLWSLSSPFCVSVRQKEQMKKKNGGKDVDEKLLFHGTNSSYLEAICNQNFDWRICGVHGTNYGKGSYFARDAKYAHSYSQSAAKRNTMFVARVLVGDFVKGNPAYVRPPQRAANMLTFYDSCVDNVLVPSIFVIFEKHQIYPEYIIDYSEEEKKCFVS
ncbi:Poly [ADP-ribose] polymerase 12 [Chelonia mydas]|uniref:Poly [ADP-ribose] polymerase 12 n=1 Tax=Chelonia mydas TaxID=8469 RepID=M7C268_CHEMY|nr:Poly [ADP-ribose] polymerase 12 [Chelonia mydas]